MGLDIVELFMAVEECFQIHVTDEEASDATTVGELEALIVGKLRVEDSKRCLTSVAFYRLRRAFVEVLGTERRQIRPDTLMVMLLPETARREKWARIQRELGLQIPKLQFPPQIDWGVTVGGVLVAMTPLPFLQAGWHTVPLLLVLPMTGYFLGQGLLRLAPQLAVEFPSGIKTAGDLSRELLERNFAALVQSTGGWNGKEVYAALCDVIVRQTGVDRAEITPESRLVDDLGID